MFYIFILFFGFNIFLLTLFFDYRYLFFNIFFIIFLLKDFLKKFLILILSIFLALFVFLFHYREYDIKGKYFEGYFIEKLRDNRYIFYSNGYYFYTKYSGVNLGKKYIVYGKVYPIEIKKGLEALKYFFDKKYRFNMWLYMKGYAGYLKIYNISQINGEYEFGFFQKTKFFIQNQIISKYGINENSSLLLGMLIGDKSYMTDEQYNKYISSQIVHLVAFSGGNFVFFGMILKYLLFFVPLHLRLLIIILLFIFLLLLVGDDSSVLRGFIMACLSIILLFFGKEIIFFKSLGIAFIILLLYNPFYFWDLGFWLSFGALIGIYLFTKDHKGIKGYFLSTLGASFGVFPILLIFQDNLSIGFIANFIVTPLAPFIMFFGLFGIFIKLEFLNYFLSFINFIANLFSIDFKIGFFLKIIFLLIYIYIYESLFIRKSVK